MAFHQTDKMAEYETNAVQREYQIQQAALRNNKLRLLRQEKGEVIEVDAPKLRAEKEAQAVTETEAQTVEPQPVDGPDTQPVVDPFISCLLYTSPSPRDRSLSRMPSSA